jgi:hypothetical protein
MGGCIEEGIFPEWELRRGADEDGEPKGGEDEVVGCQVEFVGWESVEKVRWFVGHGFW